uniref:Uncharacterized protein n=1 Tax=Anguilla anguilla TaxID=7936 RepID=A0A0E9TWJ9_ANGAN
MDILAISQLYSEKSKKNHSTKKNKIIPIFFHCKVT